MSVRDFWVGLALRIAQCLVMALFLFAFAPRDGELTAWQLILVVAFVGMFSLKVANIFGSLIGYGMIRSRIKKGMQANGRTRNNH